MQPDKRFRANSDITTQGRIVVVDIQSVSPNPENERKMFRGLEELAASIMRVGVVEPPSVVPLSQGKYMLTTGERRWRAAQKAGLTRIPVLVGPFEGRQLRRLKSLVSNIQREELTPIELAHALQQLKEDNPDIKTNRDLACVVSKSEQWVG